MGPGSKLAPSRAPSTKMALTISENVSWQSFSLSQITPLSQRLGGVAVFALVFGTGLQEALWKQEGA